MCNLEDRATEKLRFLTAGNYGSAGHVIGDNKVRVLLEQNDLDVDDTVRELANDLRDQLHYHYVSSGELKEGMFKHIRKHLDELYFHRNECLSEALAGFYNDMLDLAMAYVDWSDHARTMVEDCVQELKYTGEYADLVEELGLEEEAI